MQVRRNIVILVLLGCALAYMSVRGLYDNRSNSRRTAEGARLFKLEVADITAFEIHRAGAKLTFRKEAGGWLIEHPVLCDADIWAVNGVLEKICEMKWKRALTGSLTNPVNLKELGLDPPQTAVIFKTAAGTRKLLLGRTAPMSGLLYVAVDATGTAYLVDSSIMPRLQNELEDFRSRTVMPFNPAAVSRIQIKRPGGVVVLAVKADGWRVEKPVADRARPEIVRDLISTLASLEVERFTDDAPGDLARYGLVSPSVSVVLALQKGSDITLFLGKTAGKGNVYSATDARESVYEVKSDIVDKLTQAVNNFRDNKVLRFEIGNVIGLSLHGDKGNTVLSKSGGKWVLVDPGPLEADNGTVENILNDLANLKIIKFLPGDAQTLETCGMVIPELEVRITLTENRIVSLKFGAADAKQKQRYVMRSGDAQVFAVGAQIGYLPALSAISLRKIKPSATTPARVIPAKKEVGPPARLKKESTTLDPSEEEGRDEGKESQ